MGGKQLNFTKPTNVIKYCDDVYQMVQSPDTQFMVVGASKEKIYVYKGIDVNKPILELEGCTRSICSGCCITPAFSHDSKLLAYRWKDKVRILDLQTLKMKMEIENKEKIYTMSFSPDDQFLAVGGHSDTLNVYDLNKDSSQALVKTLKARVCQCFYADRYQQQYVIVDPAWGLTDGCQYLLSRWNNIVNVWKVTKEGVELDVELKNDRDIFDMTFSPNGQILAVGTDAGVRLYDWQKRSIIKDMKAGISDPSIMKNILNVRTAFSPDNKYFGIAQKKDCFIYTTCDQKQVAKITLPEHVNMIKFSKKGNLLGIGCRNSWHMFDFVSQKNFETYEICCQKYFSEVVPLWTNDNVLMGRWEKQLRIYKVNLVECKEKVKPCEAQEGFMKDIVIGVPVADK